MKNVPLLIVAVILAVSPPGEAAPQGNPRSLRDLGLTPTIAPGASGCSGGLVIDDGTFENGYSVNPSGQTQAARFVMRFNSPPGPLNEACVCLTRLPGGDDLLIGSVTAFDNNGPGGSPGTLLGPSSPLLAQNIPVFPSVRFYDVPLTNEGVVSDGSIYLGLSFLPGLQDDVFLCGDETGAEKSPGYLRLDNAPDDPTPWNRLGAPDLFPDYSALGVRLKLDQQSTGCTPSPTSLCLVNDRFRVKVDFHTPQGDSGQGQAVKLTPDTGYFWFFDPSNVEMVVKVLDTCSFADRFWVFAGGLTNVEVQMTVTDTLSGDFKIYTNPQRTPFQPIQDTNAFATCP